MLSLLQHQHYYNLYKIINKKKYLIIIYMQLLKSILVIDFLLVKLFANVFTPSSPILLLPIYNKKKYLIIIYIIT